MIDVGLPVPLPTMFAALLIPLIVTPLFLAAGKKLQDAMIFIVIGVLFIFSLSALMVGPGETLQIEVGFKSLDFEVKPYSRITFFSFTLVGALTLIYGMRVMNPAEKIGSIWGIAAAAGITLANNYITLYLFWELLTLSAALIILANRTDKCTKMAFRFIIIQLAGGLSLLFGIFQHFVATGSLIIETPAAGLPFFVLGIGVKAVFLPLCIWLPWGYPAASFASSVVLAGLTTKIGVFALASFLPPLDAVALMGGFMAVYGIIMALMQKNLRYLLSFHIISQVGYMVAGMGLGFSLAVDGAFLHMFNNMIYKGLLFMCAGILIYSIGTDHITELTKSKGSGEKPLWRVFPLATIGALVGSLAISGIPPFNGYVSKYLLKNAFYGTGMVETLLTIASVGSVISFAKYFYFGFLKARVKDIIKPKLTMQIGVAIASILAIVTGIWPQLIQGLLPYGSSVDVYNLQGIKAALQFGLIGIVIFIIIAKRLKKGIPIPQWLNLDYFFFHPLNRFTYKLKCLSATLVTASMKPEEEVNIETRNFVKDCINADRAASHYFYKACQPEMAQKASKPTSSYSPYIEKPSSPPWKNSPALSYLVKLSSPILNIFSRTDHFLSSYFTRTEPSTTLENASQNTLMQKITSSSPLNYLIKISSRVLKVLTRFDHFLSQYYTRYDQSKDIKKLVEMSWIDKVEEATSMDTLTKTGSWVLRMLVRFDRFLGKYFVNIGKRAPLSDYPSISWLERPDASGDDSGEGKPLGRWSILNLNVNIILVGMTLVIAVFMLLFFAQT